jgi:hypothetical protein
MPGTWKLSFFRTMVAPRLTVIITTVINTIIMMIIITDATAEINGAALFRVLLNIQERQL